MNISILGAGHAGTAVAADLTLKGHTVTLIKTSHAMHDDNFKYLVENNGRVCLVEKEDKQWANIANITRDLSQLAESETVIIYIQTNYHETLIKRIRPYLRDGQILLLNPGYLSTAYVLKHCPDIDLSVVEAQSSFIDCRISNPGTVKVFFRNARNPLGVYPTGNREKVEIMLNQLGFPFVYSSSVFEAGLHNPNLIVHTVGAIMSIPRIEKTEGDYYMYREVFTPSVWRILEALDKEKMDLMEKLGCKRVPYVEACKYRNSLDECRDAKEIFFSYANLPDPLKGPTEVDSRFISEDVPQGLVLLESLGSECKVQTPVCTALINVASAALNRDLRSEGRTVNRMGKENLRRIYQDKSEGKYAGEN